MTLFNNKPHIMGVINVTPDSFYEHSRVQSVDQALRTAEEMVKNGASIIDIGGEATNPMLDVSISRVSAEEEIERAIKVIEVIHQNIDVLISIDTSKPEVMSEAVKAGAGIINDQRALTCENAITTAAKLNVPVCLMHMYGLNVRTPNNQPHSETLTEIKNYLLHRAKYCIQAGIKQENIIIDPGFGHGNYGKSTEENLYLSKHLRAFTDTNFPVLVGLSRKTHIGEILGLPANQRLYGSIGLAVLAAINGATIIRTHDVAPTAQAIKMVMSALST